jgi:hypothetical protein
LSATIKAAWITGAFVLAGVLITMWAPEVPKQTYLYFENRLIAGDWRGTAPDHDFTFTLNPQCYWSADLSDISIEAHISNSGEVRDGTLAYTYKESPTGTCGSGIPTTHNSFQVDPSSSNLSDSLINLEFKPDHGNQPETTARFTGPFKRSSGQTTINSLLKNPFLLQL